MSKRGNGEIPRPLAGEGQSVAYTATAGRTAAAFTAQTRGVWVWATSNVHLRVGNSSVTATTSDASIPANRLVQIRVNPGEYISFRQVSAGGTAYVGELDL